jgi:AraC-like DNA-binding protein
MSATLLDFVLRQARVKTNICTLQKHEAGYTLQQRVIPDYNYIFVTRGHAVWVLNDEPVNLPPGHLLLVPPGVPHHGFSRHRRLTLGSFHVEVTLPGGQDVFALLAPPMVRKVPTGSRLDCYLRAAMEEWDRSDNLTSLMLRPWAKLITLELLASDAAAGLLAPRAVDPLVAEMLDELTRRLDHPVTLDDLARWAGFTPQHINRTFRRVLGVTPLQYLAGLRMDRAAALLVDGRLTVRAIAAQVGFDDPFYFSRLFKQHFGRSPAQYQQAAGSDSPSRVSPAPFSDVPPAD